MGGVKWFRRKPQPEPTISAEEWDRLAADRQIAWERDNPVKTYRVSFLDGAAPVKIKARLCGRFDDEYLFRNPMRYGFAEAHERNSSLVAVIPAAIIRAIEVTNADEADDQQ